MFADWYAELNWFSLATFSAGECQCAVATSQKTCFDAGKIRFCHCAAVLRIQVPKLCTDLDLSLLYILILGTYSKFARKNNFLNSSARRLHSAALLERWPQVCRVNITFTKLPTNPFVSTTKKLKKWIVNWIPLRICVRSRNTQPHLILSSRPKPIRHTRHGGTPFGGEDASCIAPGSFSLRDGQSTTFLFVHFPGES